MNDFDAIVIGAGHNSLTAAALLGRRGLEVLVVERRPVAGGIAAAEEFHPGYRAPGLLHETHAVRDHVIAELELGRHGLERRADETPVLALEEGGPGLLLWRDPERARVELGERAPRDAERYREFRAWIDGTAPFVRGILDAPPPSIGANSLRSAWPLVKQGWALRRLGPDRMLDVLRIAPMCVADWLGEWFEDDLLRAAIAGPAVAGTWGGPWAAGTAALSWMRECMPAHEIAGGPAALVEALLAACRTHGVDVRLEAGVRRIGIAGGRVTGVELESGESASAPLVLSSAEPSHTLLELVAARDLPGAVSDALQSWRCRGTTAAVRLALSGPLEIAGRDGLHEALFVGPRIDDLERASDAIKYRRMSEHPMLEVRVPTVSDPRLAPDGHHVASVLVHFAPYDLEGGWSDAARETLLERVLAELEPHAPALRDRIVGSEVLTPLDLESRYGLTGGHVHHGEHGLDQLYWLRPNAACAQYATPIDGLFLCGSGSHPGGGITCAPGFLGAVAAAARE